MHKPLLALAAAAAALLSASPALGADRTVSLSDTARKATWDGKAGPGAMEFQDCSGPTSTCDSTLVKVDDAGELIASITSDPTLSDANLRIALSNAAGDEVGLIKEATGLTGTEKLAVAVDEPGYYLVTTTNESGYGAVHATAELLRDGDEWSVAAPEKRSTLNAAKAEYKWTGLAGNGLVFDCGEVAPAVQPCDEVLVHVTEPGDLTATMSNASKTTVLDYLSIYTSDAAGTKSDDGVLAQSIDATDPNQSAGASVDPGYYLIEVGWLLAANGTYDGTVTFTPAPPAEDEGF